MRHLVTLDDLSSAEIERIFAIARDLKEKFSRGVREPLLPGRVMALLFEKQSLRTRVSFEAGMTHLGGGSMMLGDDVGFGKRESIADFTRVLSEMVDVIVVRAKSHQTVVEVAQHSTCPVINGLTDLAHPCQALADLLHDPRAVRRAQGAKARLGRRRQQRRPQPGHRLRPGGRRVRHRHAEGLRAAGRFSEAAPHRFPQRQITRTRTIRRQRSPTRSPSTPTSGPAWARRRSKQQRKRDFADYQVNAELMAAAPQGRRLHALPPRPARRGSDRRGDRLARRASSCSRPPTGCTSRRACWRGCWGRKGNALPSRSHVLRGNALSRRSASREQPERIVFSSGGRITWLFSY